MQHHSPKAPVVRGTGPGDRLARDDEIGWAGAPEEGRDLACRRGGLVDTADVARRGRTGDPAAPWERGLAGPVGVVGIRVRQRVIVTTVKAFRAEMAEIAAESEIPF
jgi:hypothetical protein